METRKSERPKIDFLSAGYSHLRVGYIIHLLEFPNGDKEIEVSVSGKRMTLQFSDVAIYAVILDGKEIPLESRPSTEVWSILKDVMASFNEDRIKKEKELELAEIEIVNTKLNEYRKRYPHVTVIGDEIYRGKQVTLSGYVTYVSFTTGKATIESFNTENVRRHKNIEHINLDKWRVVKIYGPLPGNDLRQYSEDENDDNYISRILGWQVVKTYISSGSKANDVGIPKKIKTPLALPAASHSDIFLPSQKTFYFYTCEGD